MADIQIIGDDIFYDGQKVAVLLPGIPTTPRIEFCDALNEIKSEDELCEMTDNAEANGEGAGKRSMLADVREAIETIDFVDYSAECKLRDRLEELEKLI